VTRPLRTLVVDDEKLAREELCFLLGQVGQVDIVGQASDGVEALRLAGEMKPDLLFLDVQMPGLTGFEVARRLIEADVLPQLVFVTAFDQYAVDAFSVNAVDYLLKPVAPDRFRAALARARDRLQARAALPVAEIVQSARPPGAKVERILVRDGAKVVVIAAGDLDYAEAQDDYVGLHTKGKVHLKQQTLAELAAALDPARFVRIHRSYLLNVDRLARLESEGETRAAVLTDGTRLPVSRAGHTRLKALL
jgi:two-component system LytT family response regulator